MQLSSRGLKVAFLILALCLLGGITAQAQAAAPPAAAYPLDELSRRVEPRGPLTCPAVELVTYPTPDTTVIPQARLVSIVRRLGPLLIAAEGNRVRELVIPAARGQILDQLRRALAVNRIGLDIAMYSRILFIVE